MANRKYSSEWNLSYISSYKGILTLKLTVKPIFHWKLGSLWLPNVNEINTKNMKCTRPTSVPRIGDPTPPIFHLLALGVGVWGNANFSVPVGVILALLDTNMLVSSMQNCGVGGLSQREDPTRMVLHRSGI